jgi:hypothetical protein
VRETKAEEESCRAWEDAGHLGCAYCLQEREGIRLGPLRPTFVGQKLVRGQ